MSQVLMTRSAPALSLRSLAMALALTASALTPLAPLTAHAGATMDGTISALSSIPMVSMALSAGVSGGVPQLTLSASAALILISAEVADGTVTWVLESAADGSRFVLKTLERGVKMASVAVGTALVVTATSAGWVLSAAGQALCFVPNEIGASLSYNERITR